MQMQTAELRCPYCHAAQPSVEAGHHTCAFCLHGFTAFDAARARQTSAEQTDAWLRGRVGSNVDSPVEVIDRASRGYIFNQRIFPELRRDVARVHEGLGPWLQAPLILPELSRAPGGAPHPLSLYSGRMQALVALSGRLGHSEVQRFAVDEVAKAQLEQLGAPIDELIHLINIVEAGQRGGADGWGAVRSNLEAMASRPLTSSESDRFAGLRRERWQLLAALTRHYDDCARGQHSPSQLEGIEALIVSLRGLAERLRACASAPVEARAFALAVEREAEGAQLLARWLRCSERLPRAPEDSLPHLYTTLAPLIPPGSSPDRAATLVEGWTELAAVSRQEIAICVIEDFAWAEAWAESVRGRKRLGLFGEDEVVETIERFLLPVWVAELRYSQQRGRLLGGGVEQRTLALLDACAGTAETVAIFDPVPEPLRAALTHPVRVGAIDIALPETTAADARVVMQRALSRRPEFQNARFEVRGLALIPAVTVRLRARAGQRQVSTALQGRVQASKRARERVETARWLFARFAR